MVKKKKKIKERAKDIKMQREIRSRADYSLAILGMMFVHRGSGKFLNIRSTKDRY